MSFDIEAALRDGYDRTLQRNALVLVGVFVAIGLAASVAQDSIVRVVHENYIDYESIFAGVDPAEVTEVRTAVADSIQWGYLDLSLGVLIALVLAVHVFRLVIKVGAIRTFVSDETERLPAANFTRRLGWVLLNLIVGMILYAIVVGIGLMLFVLPGVFLAVALFFYNYEIVVGDKNVFEAFAGSWNLTEGNRIGLFLLGLAVAIIGFVLGLLGGFAGLAGAGAGLVVQTVIGAAISVFGIAVAAQAYNQLRGADRTGEADEPVESESPGALGPDDLA